MKQPRPFSTQPGISINGHTLFMNGEAIGVLHADPARAHARQDFEDFITTLAASGLQTPDDLEDYRVRGFLEAEVESLQDQVEHLECELEAALSRAVDA